MLKTVVDVKGIPLRGGAITVRDRGLLKLGEFSMVQNVKPLNPGFEKRKGQRVLNPIADTPNQFMSVYQFKKTKASENIYLIQASDGDILQTDVAPPSTAIVLSELYSGNASPIPASWGNANDLLVFTTGVDQHLLYPGALSTVHKFIKYTTGSNPITSDKSVFEGGVDYTEEVTDGQSSTYADLGSLGLASDGDGILICTPVPAKSLTVTVVNTNSKETTGLKVYYWKNDCSWAEVSSLSDGTSTDSISFAKSGTISWTEPTTIQDRMLFGMVGYWYLLVFDDTLDSSVTVSQVTYNASVTELKSLWDGVPVLAPTVLVDDGGDGGAMDTYSGSSVDVDSLASGSFLYIFSTDMVEGFYFDPGATPNATADIDKIYYWTGSAWAELTTVHNGCDDFAHAGWVLVNRQTASQPHQLEGNKLFGHWYKLVTKTGAVDASVVLSVATMPFFDIHDWGYYGQSSCVWKGRGVYSWSDKWPEYVYITQAESPQVLVGIDAGILEVGDGRPHKITAMKNFFNNVLIFQEERGEIGGCITMLQGYDPPTFGKLVLSTKLGTMNAKSVDVVENVYTATATDEELKTVAFFLSRYGVGACDGTSIGIISDDIQNYFDPNSSVCIRRGYENQMWLKHDPIEHVLRLGLVSGASATTPNVFPVYDLVARVWYFDVRAQELSCWENVEAGSGDTSITQIAGGVDDGTLYQVNYGTADVSTAIDTYIRLELPGYGQYLDLLQFMLTCKAQTGNITLTTYQNNIEKDSLTLSMAAAYSTQEIRRHLLSLNVIDQQISIKIQNSSTTESATIMAAGLELKLWQNR